MRRARARAGFGLLWLIVGMIVFVTIVATAVPIVVAAIDVQRLRTTATILYTLDSADVGPRGFNNFVGHYPGLLHDLATQITTVLPDHNSCGSSATYTTGANGDSAKWKTNGPFVNFVIGTEGLVTPLGTILDSIKRDTIAGNAFMRLNMLAVDSQDIRRLDNLIDGGIANAQTTGLVQWTVEANQALWDLKFEMGSGIGRGTC